MLPLPAVISPATINPVAYYSSKVHLFSTLAQHCAESGQLDPMALYLILDWKSARPRTRHLRRLAEIAGSFDMLHHRNSSMTASVSFDGVP
jgi:hypothetical protein